MVGLILTDVPPPQARQGKDALVFYFPPGRRANETPEHRVSVTGIVREPNGDGQHGN
jgi:hypothetical protein